MTHVFVAKATDIWPQIQFHGEQYSIDRLLPRQPSVG
jgi:hypothetical protein